MKKRSYLMAALVIGLACIAGFAQAHGVLPPEVLAGLTMAPFCIGEISMVEVKKLIEDQGTAWHQYKQTNEDILKSKAEGKAVADLEAKLAKIDEVLNTKSAEWEEILKKMQRPSLGDSDEAKGLEAETKSFNAIRRADSNQQIADVSVDDYKAYKSAFFNLARKASFDFLSDAEKKALSAGVDSDGGYLMPPATAGRIVQRVYDLSPIRAISNVMVISGDALEGIADIDEATAGWVSETGTRSDSTTPTVNKYRIEAHEMYSMPKATQKLLDDAAVDVEAWLAGKVADKFARVEAAAFVNGTGVGQPRGFATYTTAATADASRTWGQLEHVVTGANGAFHTTQADPLFDLIQAFKPGYLGNARWVTTRAVIAAIRKFKTTTTLEYIWQPGLQVGTPDKLLGYPVVNAQDMPALATNSLSMALGDFNEGYQIIDRLGMRVLRDPYTAKPYVVFYTTKRTGGGVVNFEAIKFIKFST